MTPKITLTMCNQLIMLIDDDPIVNFISSKVLNKYNEEFEILDFQKALDALYYLRQHPEKSPDVIFLDLNMPEMDGWEFLQEYEKLNLRSDLYILTSSFAQRDVNKSKHYSKVKDFIIKPLTKQTIQRILAV
jgi:response regulator RpfG family c-di-GMP phosphodiesterase